MRHLESLMGEEVFRDGLREYLKALRVRQRHLDRPDRGARRAHADGSRAWSQVWVEEPRPSGDLHDARASTDGEIARLAFEQRDLTRKRGSGRSNSASLRRLSRRRAEDRCTSSIDGARVDVAKAAVGMPAPLYVLPNGERLGLRRLPCSIATSLDYLLDSLPEIADPLTRGAAWVTLWDALLDGTLCARRDFVRSGAARAAARDRRAAHASACSAI